MLDEFVSKEFFESVNIKYQINDVLDVGVRFVPKIKKILKKINKEKNKASESVAIK